MDDGEVATLESVISIQWMGRGYFEVMGIPLRQGRTFSRRPSVARPAARPAVVGRRGTGRTPLQTRRRCEQLAVE